MKKTMNLVAIISLLFFTACSTVSKKTETPEERFTREQIKNWEVTIDENLKKKCTASRVVRRGKCRFLPKKNW